MRKKISIIILIITVIASLCIFPLNLVRRELQFSSGDTEPYSKTPNLNPGVVLLQGFIAQESYLKELSFAFSPIDSLPEDTNVLFELVDTENNVLISKNFTAADIVDTSYCTVPIDKWLKKGNLYAYTLTVSGSSGNNLVLYTTPNPINFVAGNTNLALNGAPLEGQAYNLYIYTEPLNYKNIACTWAFIWVIGMSLYSISIQKTTKRNLINSKKEEEIYE